MNTTTKHRLHDKTKVNGKWISHAVERGEKAALANGPLLLEMAQDTAGEMLDSSGKLAKKAGAKALAYGKSHPVQIGVGGVVLGLMLGARIFAGRK